MNDSTTTGRSGSSRPRPAIIRLGRVRADLVERQRDVVAAERVAQRVGALVALLADETDRREAGALRQVPVVERVGHGPVELLVARPLRSQQRQVGVALRHRAEDPRRAGEVAPRDPHRALGRRVEGVGAAEEVEPLAVLGAVVARPRARPVAPTVGAPRAPPGRARSRRRPRPRSRRRTAASAPRPGPRARSGRWWRAASPEPSRPRPPPPLAEPCSSASTLPARAPSGEGSPVRGGDQRGRWVRGAIRGPSRGRCRPARPTSACTR